MSIETITDFLTEYSRQNNDAYDWIGTQSDACDFVIETMLPILKEEGVMYASIFGYDFDFHGWFTNAVDPIFSSPNLNPSVQFQSFYWTNSTYHRDNAEPIYSQVIDVNIQQTSLKECIMDYIEPVHNHIDPNPATSNETTRIQNVFKTNCFISLPNILICRLKRWNE